MPRQDLVVRFIGDTGNLTKGADQVQGRLQAVATGLKGIAAAGAVVGAVSYFSNAIQEAREAARVTRQTENVLRSTGGAANVTAKEVSALAEELSKVAGVDDEVIQSGQNVLLTFTRVRNEVGHGNDVFNQATERALDMSAALGKDLQGSVILVGKALQDPIKGMTAMSRAGVQFTAQQKEEIQALIEKGDLLGAQKIILGELETQFGGMAAASADAGDKLKVAWDNLAEDVGNKLMPAFTSVSTWGLEKGIPALTGVASAAADVVGPAFRGVISVGREAIEFFDGLPGPIQAGAVALGAWMLIGDRVTERFGRLSAPLRTFGSDVRTVMTASQGEVGRFGSSLQVLQDRSPSIGAMGTAFRTAKGDVEGFANTAKGVGAAAFTGLRSAAGGLVGFLGGPWGIALTAAVVGIGLWSSSSKKAEEKQRQLAEAGRSVADALREQNGVINESVRQTAGKVAEDAGLLKAAQQLNIPLSAVTDAILGQGDAYGRLQGFLKGVQDSHHELVAVETGAADGALAYRDQLDAEGQTARELAVGIEGLTQKKDAQVQADLRVTEASAGTTAQVGQQKFALDTTAASTQLFNEVIEQAGVKMDEAKTDGQNLAAAIKAIGDAEVATIEAEEAYETALNRLTESVRTNGVTLDIHTEKGLNNRDALQAAAVGVRDMTLADLESGVPMQEAIARHDRRTAALQEEARKLFGAKQETRNLITAYSQVPNNVRTMIQTMGFEETLKKLQSLSGRQRLLAEGLADTPANRKALRIWEGHAAGGYINGPGGPTSDVIPAWLSNGEFVQRASAVNYYGVDVMSALNKRMIPREQLAPRFAAGGLMTWPFNVNVSKTKIPTPPMIGGAWSGTLGPGLIGTMQQWALAQRGKRYLWGGVGPGSYDCSGLVGNLYAMATGQPLYRRYMTTATMGPGRYGMKPGRGAFTIYLGPGHTAANIGGLHAEAYGGNGTPLAIGRVGTPLSFYNRIMHLFASGGLVGLKSNPAKRRESFLERGWPEPDGFKHGGWLQPGGMAYNETSKPEAVFTQDQLRKLSAGRVEKHYHLTVYATNSETDIREQFSRMELLDGAGVL